MDPKPHGQGLCAKTVFASEAPEPPMFKKILVANDGSEGAGDIRAAQPNV
jgi:hypothetical protein